MNWTEIMLAVLAAPTCVFLAVVLFRIVVRIGYASICAADVCRLAVAAERVHGPLGSRWRWMPKLFLIQLASFIESDPKNITIYGSRGNWYGLGNWKVKAKRFAE